MLSCSLLHCLRRYSSTFPPEPWIVSLGILILGFLGEGYRLPNMPFLFSLPQGFVCLTLVLLRDTEAFWIWLIELHHSFIRTVPPEERFSKKALSPFGGTWKCVRCNVKGYWPFPPCGQDAKILSIPEPGGIILPPLPVFPQRGNASKNGQRTPGFSRSPSWQRSNHDPKTLTHSLQPSLLLAPHLGLSL